MIQFKIDKRFSEDKLLDLGKENLKKKVKLAN